MGNNLKEINEQELNKKLAEWAGFKLWQGSLYWYPSDTGAKRLPHFTKSLDACFEWLVPKLPDPRRILFNVPHSINNQILETVTKGWIAGIESGDFAYLGTNNTPALALCLAIEKLIDHEEKE